VIPYLGCDAARELLHPFVDGELPMADQVAVESHLRWCRTCADRVDDLRLIGASIRLGSPAFAAVADEEPALAAIQSDVLTRIGAERDQSFAVRFRGLFEDMRFFWPALGASAALVAFLCTAAIITRTARDLSPHSMADVIEMLANPGSDRNPILLNADMLAPRRLNEEPMLESIPGEEVVFALAAVVTREGRVADYRLLRSERASVRLPGADPADIDALLAAVRESRFEPAQTRGGAVAVNMVWLLARTTVKASAQEYDLGSLPRLPAVEEIAKPLSADPPPPVPRPARS
jgi:hypothetical protein